MTGAKTQKLEMIESIQAILGSFSMTGLYRV